MYTYNCNNTEKSDRLHVYNIIRVNERIKAFRVNEELRKCTARVHHKRCGSKIKLTRVNIHAREKTFVIQLYTHLHLPPGTRICLLALLLIGVLKNDARVQYNVQIIRYVPNR